MEDKSVIKPRGSNLYDSIFSANKHSLLFKIKRFAGKYILALDLAAIILFFGVFGMVYLIKADKTYDSSLVSPMQKATGTVLNNSSVEESKVVNSGLVTNKKEVIGFLPSWAIAQNVNVDIKAMTQVIYFGIGVNDNGELIQYSQENKPTFEWLYFTSDYFSYLKSEAKKSNTKVLVAFKMFDNENIDNLISNSASTEFFIQNVLKILKKYDLDGVNLDFEYFTDSNFPTVRYMNKFLETISYALKNANPQYILSVDINATVMLLDKAYDLVKMGEVADQIIVMAYDYRTAISSVAGPVAPLHSLGNEHGIEQSINSLAGRVALEKVILAVPFYGYEWETVNKKYKSETIPNSGALATYKRVQELLGSRPNIVRHWDETSMSPWLAYTQSGAIKQIYYEDERSILAKTEFIKSKNLGGIAVWAIGYEGKHDNLWNIVTKVSN